MALPTLAECVNRRTLLAGSGAALTTALAGCVDSLETGGSSDRFETDQLATGFNHPWGLTVVPDDGRLLVTEREGGLSVLDPEDGTVVELDGAPEADTANQGGLLDAAFHPDFPTAPWLYLTYSTANADGSTTALARGRLDTEAAELTALEEVFVAEPFVDSDAHYGSRVVFGADELVYVTVGDRQFKDFGPDHVSQDTSTPIGSTVRLEPDGSIPEDNPFVDDDDDAADAIFSYGHRNAQGMTVHPDTGDLWQSEHGEEDGDELNIIEGGGNYGWPIAAYGCEYGTDEPIGDEPDDRDDVVDPVYYWECGSGGFPPAGMTFYDGEAFPDWEGDLFVGNLAGAYLGRFTVDGTDVEEADPLLADRGWRIRDVEVDPASGDLFVAVDDADAPIVRLSPS